MCGLTELAATEKLKVSRLWFGQTRNNVIDNICNLLSFSIHTWLSNRACESGKINSWLLNSHWMFGQRQVMWAAVASAQLERKQAYATATALVLT